MTAREGVQERGTGVSPVRGHRQANTMPRLLRQFLALGGLSPSAPLACDLPDGSRLRNNPVHADDVIIPSRIAPFTTPFIPHAICEFMDLVHEMRCLCEPLFPFRFCVLGSLRLQPTSLLKHFLGLDSKVRSHL